MNNIHSEKTRQAESSKDLFSAYHYSACSQIILDIQGFF